MERYKVLVIEDDKSARKQLAKVIQKEGFEVVVAQNGQEGLEIFKKELPEIVITDLRMPGIDGLEVMHTVTRFSTNVQTILITAFGETDTAIMALREGALDYLKKPIDLDRLMLALGRGREKIDEYKKAVPFPTLLLAEDEKITRERLTRVLEKEGWKVFSAADGEEAIKVFQQGKIDIALLDIKMPKKDGLETLHKMRDITKDFEVIVFTGYGDESSAIQAMCDGAINFLRKPIDLDEMIMSVKKAMERLTSDRSLKYRIRELELAKEIIARITPEKEVIIDARDHARKAARDFAQSVIEALPMALVILGKDMKIRYINRHLSKVFEYEPEKIDEEFVKKLDEIGVTELSHESLTSAINKVFESPHGTIETISTGKYSYLVLVPVTILSQKEKKEKVVLIAMRGERKQAS